MGSTTVYLNLTIVTALPQRNYVDVASIRYL